MAEFPIYGLTNGGDLVKIISAQEYVLLQNKVDANAEKPTAKAFYISPVHCSLETGSSQYYMAYLGGNLKEATEEEYETELAVVVDNIANA